MFIIKSDNVFEDGMRLVEGVLSGKSFSLVLENNKWREQLGNFKMYDKELMTFMDIAIFNK
ncbi:hypothetical protein [Clostridium tagluense]|uniref:hypothetical protein n=1 Tax=Clostridium tagluense TaxID=360422 RepID=UPI001CF473D7|nr:hypothetical protein [Clostridium tagluense]MCB2300674.1 hypothetical protein [Clostridium tagluense]